MKKLSIVLLSLICTVVLSASVENNLCDSIERKSITFILGEDANVKDQYYELAKRYHLINSIEKTDYFIDTCRSLLAVRNQLESLASENHIKWGDINLIVHSNQWTGMSVPILPSGTRTNVDDLIASIVNGSFAPVSDYYLDRHSEMKIKACGLGQNKALIEALQLAFGGMDEERPIIHSSKNFIQYFENDFGEIVSKELEPFYAFYKTAYRPANLHIENQFMQRYPNEPIEWLDVLERHENRGIGLFTKRFNVPIEWEVMLSKDEKVSDFELEKDKLAFVNRQEDLMKILNEFNIPIEKFRWTLTSELHNDSVVVKIKGKSTVVCILREV